MKESAERTVKVGFHRNPKRVFDEVESLAAQMKREGWSLRESIMEEGLGKIHLFFEREINTIIDWPDAGASTITGKG
jgi:hypothetical protein